MAKRVLVQPGNPARLAARIRELWPTPPLRTIASMRTPPGASVSLQANISGGSEHLEESAAERVRERRRGCHISRVHAIVFAAQARGHLLSGNEYGIERARQSRGEQAAAQHGPISSDESSRHRCSPSSFLLGRRAPRRRRTARRQRQRWGAPAVDFGACSLAEAASRTKRRPAGSRSLQAAQLRRHANAPAVPEIVIAAAAVEKNKPAVDIRHRTSPRTDAGSRWSAA